MPLAFESLSHGIIPFGFFNIDSDMLLLDRTFFFATEFCARIPSLTARKEPQECPSVPWRVYEIDSPGAVGDLMGAIHGTRYTGFIGEVYKVFPFPSRQEDFKQKPEGVGTQDTVRGIIDRFARLRTIAFHVDPVRWHVHIGDYRFSRPSFQELIAYVYRGGYPRWLDERRPDYVEDMRRWIDRHPGGIFEEISFEG